MAAGLAVGLSAGGALLVGACLGPTDATAVAALGKEINRFGRTVLQAESLLNIRLVGTPFWSVLTYLMNTVLFIMVGLSLPDIVRRLPRQELVPALVLIPIIYLVMVAARFVGHHAIIFCIRALDRRPQQRERCTNIRGRLVSTVAGFRATVSLAISRLDTEGALLAGPIEME